MNMGEFKNALGNAFGEWIFKNSFVGCQGNGK